jgi:hypothetical protein
VGVYLLVEAPVGVFLLAIPLVGVYLCVVYLCCGGFCCPCCGSFTVSFFGVFAAAEFYSLNCEQHSSPALFVVYPLANYPPVHMIEIKP